MGMATAWTVYVAIILGVRMAVIVIVLAVGAVNMGFLLHKAYSGM